MGSVLSHQGSEACRTAEETEVGERRVDVEPQCLQRNGRVSGYARGRLTVKGDRYPTATRRLPDEDDVEAQGEPGAALLLVGGDEWHAGACLYLERECRREMNRVERPKRCSASQFVFGSS